MTMAIAGDFFFLLLKSVGENQQHGASQTAIVVWEPLVSLGLCWLFSVDIVQRDSIW
jgi:hypothetical protein